MTVSMYPGSKSSVFRKDPGTCARSLRWRSDIWSTNRGAAEVGTPDIRPSTEDDIRHNATTQDKDLLRIIMPFRFRFHFHYRMLRKKAKQAFEASSLKFF